MKEVWVPGGLEFLDRDWNDYPGWEQITVEIGSPNFEWFGTEEACQAECDRRNQINEVVFRSQYDEYVAHIENENAAAQRAWRRRVKEHKVLVEAGLRQPKKLDPPGLNTPQTFEQWGGGRNPGARWEPVEFKRSPADPHIERD